MKSFIGNFFNKYEKNHNFLLEELVEVPREFLHTLRLASDDIPWKFGGSKNIGHVVCHVGNGLVL